MDRHNTIPLRRARAMSEVEAETKRKKASTILLEIAEDAALFRTADGEAFADMRVDKHRETWAVRGAGFKAWLRRRYFETTKSAPNAEAQQEALGVIEARALFEKGTPVRGVFTRVGAHDGKLYLDLCDEAWRVVEIDRTGWRVIQDPPVRFLRAPNMLPLPIPVSGGSLDMLRGFLNVKSDDDFALVKAFVQATLRPDIPYPILALGGEQGAAKSTAAQVLKTLVDPNKLPLRSLPRDEGDLFIAAKSNQVLVLDNLSGLQPWLSDSLCRLSTGGGVGKRALYTNGDESVIDGMRPVILTAITDVVTRGDLADRALPIVFEVIGDDQRKAKAEFWAAFAAKHAAILGGLLDTIVVGLRTKVKLARLPRMADFAVWGCACDGGRTGEGSFIDAYTKNRADAVATVVENDPVASAVLAFMKGRPEWEGNATALLAELNRGATDTSKADKAWPTAAHVLSGRLKRAAPALRQSGVAVTWNRDMKARAVTLRAVGVDRGDKTASSTSSASSAAENCGGAHDASHDVSLATDGKRHPSVMAKPAEILAHDAHDAHDASSAYLSGSSIDRAAVADWQSPRPDAEPGADCRRPPNPPEDRQQNEWEDDL